MYFYFNTLILQANMYLLKRKPDRSASGWLKLKNIKLHGRDLNKPNMHKCVLFLADISKLIKNK